MIAERGKWPKSFPSLTPEQAAISNDFMRHWHEVLPAKFSVVDRFGHEFAVKAARRGFERTLEIGAGIGEHIGYERLSSAQEAGYVAVDIRPNMVAQHRKSFPQITAVVADCQDRLPFQDGHFDRILAIHVLEHLPNLPAAVRELHRLCTPLKGQLCIAIPCEGGFAYGLARRVSAQRIFEKRYGQSYRWFIEREHVNRPCEIFEELALHFDLHHTKYFPLPLPVPGVNLCIGATLSPRLL